MMGRFAGLVTGRIALILMSAAVIAGCSDEPAGTQVVMPGGSGSATPTGSTASTGSGGPSAAGISAAPANTRGPSISFDRAAHDFGTVWDVDEQRCTFSFVNNGSETLTIKELKASCGCTKPRLDKMVYAPGEGAELDIVYHPNGQGRTSKTVTVVSDAVGGDTKLTLHSNVQSFLGINPSKVLLQPFSSKTGTTDSFEFSPADPNFQLDSVAATSSGLAQFLDVDYRKIDAPAGVAGARARYRVVLTVRPGTPWGMNYGAVEVKGRGRVTPDSPEIEVEGKYNLRGHSFRTVFADNVMFQPGPVAKGGTFQKTVTLRRNDGQPFKLTSLGVEGALFDGLVTSAVPPIGTTAPQFVLTLDGSVGPYVGRITGNVIAGTDVPGDERLEFRIAGIVR